MIRDGIAMDKQHYEAKHKHAVDRRLDEAKRHIDQSLEYWRNSDRCKIEVGDRVFLQEPYGRKRRRITGTIERKGANEREFWVRTDRGSLFRRNRCFIKLQDPSLKKTNNATQQQNAPTSPKAAEKDVPMGPRGRPPGSKKRVTIVEPKDVRRSTQDRHQTVRYGQ